MLSQFGSEDRDVASQSREGIDELRHPAGGMPIDVVMALIRLYRDPPDAAGARRVIHSVDRTWALERLRAIRELRSELDRIEPEVAATALTVYDVRLEDVGDALGMSRSAAHRRFGGGR